MGHDVDVVENGEGQQCPPKCRCWPLDVVPTPMTGIKLDQQQAAQVVQKSNAPRLMPPWAEIDTSSGKRWTL